MTEGGSMPTFPSEIVRGGREVFVSRLERLMNQEFQQEALSLSILNLFNDVLGIIFRDLQAWMEARSVSCLEILSGMSPVVKVEVEPELDMVDGAATPAGEEEEEKKVRTKMADEEEVSGGEKETKTRRTSRRKKSVPSRLRPELVESFKGGEGDLSEESNVMECKLCGKQLSSKGNMWSHMKRTHGEGCSERVVCDICGLSVLKINLKMHMSQAHDPQGSYQCSHCPAVFKNKYHTKKHERHKHSDVSLHVCSICGIKCITAAALRVHENIHRGIRPYPCDLCEKRFFNRSCLNRHKLRSHGDTTVAVRRYPCPECSKSYVDKRSLRDHRNIHLGLRPHTCPTCGSGFAYEGALHTHRRVAHKYPGKNKEEEQVFAMPTN
ncbi:unnamed protein product [Cyprideis torosa]|uniref:Uncharacterized protein n=1 Tax=Cyprideis torosa TaxID=163714 RepID=A0A7R8WCF0_9CRUS|nr:unnamed protein product [Cyprideis torosa]CAG0887434.1 unnamed protein product [Cyprideis torosa]